MKFRSDEPQHAISPVALGDINSSIAGTSISDPQAAHERRGSTNAHRAKAAEASRVQRDEDPLPRRGFAGALGALGLLALSGCVRRGDDATKDDGPDDPSATAREALTTQDALLQADPPSGDTTGVTDTAALQNFLSLVGSSGRLGIIPPGTFYINAALTLPVQGIVWGSGRKNTIITTVGDIDAFQVPPGSQQQLYLGHLQISGASQTSKAGIRLMNHVGQLQEVYIHDIFMYYVRAGIDSAAGASGLLGIDIRRVLIAARGFAIYLQNTTACKLLYVTSDHLLIQPADRDNTQIRDIWINGNSGAGGGCYLDHVVSQWPAQNGVVIENFVQLWARHVTGDNALERGIWLVNCEQVHLHQAFASIGGRNGSPAGFSMVIESPVLKNSNITLDQCHVGGSASAGGLYVKKISNISIVNGTFIDNAQFAIKLESCENVSISGALVGCKPGSVYGIYVLASSYVTVSNVVLTTTSTMPLGIKIESSSAVTVAGCQVRGTGGTGYGIQLHSSPFCAITGNSVIGWSRGIIETGTSDYNTISSNMCVYNGGSYIYGVVTVGYNSLPAPGSNTRTALNIT